MFKDKNFRKYFVRFFISILLLQLSFLAEQRYLKNTPQQQQNSYNKLQEIIRNKELSFVRIYQQLIADSANFDKNWINVNAIAEKENTIIQVFKNIKQNITCNH